MMTRRDKKKIFGHLHPLDLLHLARTTKPFRRVLMHRSAISVWKEARSNVDGLPECHPSMSEPAYANLAFDSHCHVCNSPSRYCEQHLIAYGLFFFYRIAREITSGMSTGNCAFAIVSLARRPGDCLFWFPNAVLLIKSFSSAFCPPKISRNM